MAKNGKSVIIKSDDKVESIIRPTIIPNTSKSDKQIQFRIYVGSYEHSLLCLSVILEEGKTPVFHPIFHFQAHSLSIKAIAAAKRYLVTGSNDEHINIYDLQKRKELGTLLGHQGTVTALTFSHEGGDEIQKEEGKAGRWLLSGSDDGKIIIWRTKDWEVFGTLKGHKGRINDIAIHPSGRIAVSVGDDKTVKLWNLMTAKKAATLKVKNDWQTGEYVRWSVKGDYFIVGLKNKILIYKTSEAKAFKELAFKSTLMHLETFELEGVEYVVVGLGNGQIAFYKLDEIVEGEEEELKIEPAFTFQGHTNRVKDFLFHRFKDNTYLVSISSDGNIVIWDLKIKDQVAVYSTGERLNCVEVSSEQVEKFETMKRRYDEIDEEAYSASESENEDTEELKKIMLDETKKKKKKNSKSKKAKKITVELE